MDTDKVESLCEQEIYYKAWEYVNVNKLNGLKVNKVEVNAFDSDFYIDYKGLYKVDFMEILMNDELLKTVREELYKVDENSINFKEVINEQWKIIKNKIDWIEIVLKEDIEEDFIESFDNDLKNEFETMIVNPAYADPDEEYEGSNVKMVELLENSHGSYRFIQDIDFNVDILNFNKDILMEFVIN